MPVDLVCDHATTRLLGHVAYSAVLNIACRYWLGRCKALPEQSADRMALARISAPGWVRHGAEIEAALAEILPILSHAREARLTDMEDRRARALRGHARQVAEGRAPHLSPHHASKRRKRGVASAADVIAHAALEAAGITDRRVSAAEVNGSAVIAHRAARVDLSGVTGLGHAVPPPDSTATIPPPAHPAKPRSGMRETTKR